ncbi:uncharacterized protein B0I36DRAFT_323324 [Microdochium trichocladiopsis]|uniref:Secreted protein n=1 Tax=Microdochium trichocladiopsis TaxID=1682393 RepID=A0A9P8Y9C3_9PEZI|nr:uncharacterized protein B0I36DRAFT_323324 [Microdochium trichocladiopsis]KAH7031169.1 hypothetical protein B0I36DRAFT_323324 [Microdochium trichocladiopsis]
MIIIIIIIFFFFFLLLLPPPPATAAQQRGILRASSWMHEINLFSPMQQGSCNQLPAPWLRSLQHTGHSLTLARRCGVAMGPARLGPCPPQCSNSTPKRWAGVARAACPSNEAHGCCCWG